MRYEVLDLLESELGGYVTKNKDNYAFHCPFCNHQKHKLEIQLSSGNWHCWVCDSRGKSLFSLFKGISVTPNKLQKLKEVTGDTYYSIDDENIDYSECKLPDEYIPLWHKNEESFAWKLAMGYLSSRGVTIRDIMKYRIGYALSGKYNNMLIFPNYDKNGTLNYFTTRTFIRSQTIRKFVNPPYSRDVVGFELQLNWSLPIILVESALDAITIKRNASPLYGSMLPNALKAQIIENKVKELYICLDKDAIKKAIRHTEYFISNGVDVRFIELEDDRDVNALGYDLIWQKIKSTAPASSNSMFGIKIRELFNAANF